MVLYVHMLIVLGKCLSFFLVFLLKSMHFNLKQLGNEERNHDGVKHYGRKRFMALEKYPM